MLLAFAHSLPMLRSLAWLVLGVGMGFGLYDAAFAVLGRIYGTNARGAITGITLHRGLRQHDRLAADGVGRRRHRLARYLPGVGGAASRHAPCRSNYWALPRPTVTAEDKKAMDKPVPIDRAMILLGFAFARAWIVTARHGGALPAHPGGDGRVAGAGDRRRAR